MGRVVAVALMLAGISLVGIVTATLASWIVQRVAEEDTAATTAHIEELRAEIRQLAKSGTDSADNSQPLPGPPTEHPP